MIPTFEDALAMSCYVFATVMILIFAVPQNLGHWMWIIDIVSQPATCKISQMYFLTPTATQCMTLKWF